VIMHDGGGDRSETVQALATLLPALHWRGYRFITLDEMFYPHRRTAQKKHVKHHGAVTSGFPFG